ncbi:MAG: monovalent cation/H(+) antiporter subunit G [Comamonas sp.]
MIEVALPVWAQVAVSALVLCGAVIALLGALGLFRLPTYYQRVHAPAVIATLGCWCVVWGSVLYFSLQTGAIAGHALLIAIFIAVTTPITTIFLMRAALFRDRRMGKSVPPSLSRIVTTDTPDA